MLYYGYKGLVVFVFEWGYYFLGKMVDLLGIGCDNIIVIEIDKNNKVDVNVMCKKVYEFEVLGIKVMVLVGVVGIIEIGSIDLFNEMVDLSVELGCYFYVDVVWGGVILLLMNYCYFLSGIECVDLIIIDVYK